MAEFIEKVAIDWVEIRAGRIRIRKGHPTSAQMKQLRALIEADPLPVSSSFWVTRDRRIHFKPSFPASLRPAVRSIMVP